jgi:hypothetical protein
MTLKISSISRGLKKIKGLLILSFLLLLPLSFSGCARAKVPFCPKVSFVPPPECLSKKPSPFQPLIDSEAFEDWAKELKIGFCFAFKYDYFRAIGSFQRALFLIEPFKKERINEIEYNIILCYYLGEKYEKALQFFEESTLKCTLSKDFPAFADLLVILYDSASKVKECPYKEKVMKRLEKFFPLKAQNVWLYDQIANGNLECASKLSYAPPYLSKLNRLYESEKKNPKTAEILNALVPGLGYLYVGQSNTAITAFLVNGLFIWATYQFFHKGYIPLGVITLSLEGGWYFGGIYGAKRAACQYNEKKYECYGRKALDKGFFYPILQLNFTF